MSARVSSGSGHQLMCGQPPEGERGLYGPGGLCVKPHTRCLDTIQGASCVRGSFRALAAPLFAQFHSLPCPDVFVVEAGCPRAISIELLSRDLPVRAMSWLQVPFQVKKETPAPLALLSRLQIMLWRGVSKACSVSRAVLTLLLPELCLRTSLFLGSTFAR